MKRRLFYFLISLVLALSFCSCSKTYEYKEYDWGDLCSKPSDWYSSDEARLLGDEILFYQHEDGGWKKDMAGDPDGTWKNSTVDNDATTSQIHVLAKIYNETGKAKYKNGCIKGIELFLNNQYSNGGWPQVFGDVGGYHTHITFNDNAMTHILELLYDVKNKDGDFSFVSDSLAKRAEEAFDKGLQCVLDCQIIDNGVLTAWCQQHDEFTLEPTSARSYELASICTGESVGIVNFLKSLDEKTPEIENAIDSAIAWFDSVKISGYKIEYIDNVRTLVEDPNAPYIWARFYTLGDHTPLFVERDGTIRRDYNDVDAERRNGYAWYGNWPKNLIK